MRNPDHPGGDWPGAWGSLPEAPTLAIGSLCEKRSRWLLSGTVVKMMITSTVRGVKRNQKSEFSATGGRGRGWMNVLRALCSGVGGSQSASSHRTCIAEYVPKTRVKLLMGALYVARSLALNISPLVQNQAVVLVADCV